MWGDISYPHHLILNFWHKFLDSVGFFLSGYLSHSHHLILNFWPKYSQGVKLLKHVLQRGLSLQEKLENVGPLFTPENVKKFSYFYHVPKSHFVFALSLPLSQDQGPICNQSDLKLFRLLSRNLATPAPKFYTLSDLVSNSNENIKSQSSSGSSEEFMLFPPQAIIGMTIVSNSAINPFIFLLFNSRSPRALGITRNCCPLVRGGLLSTTRY